MSRFSEKMVELQKEHKKSADSKRTPCNKGLFNEVATALLNDPTHEVEVITQVDGEATRQTVNPTKDLRAKIITTVAKEAGCDKQEQEKLVEGVQFGTLPVYDFVSEAMTSYMSLDKRFRFLETDEVSASLTLEAVEEEEKEHRVPGTDTTVTKNYGAHRKVKAKSSCPAHKATKIK